MPVDIMGAVFTSGKWEISDQKNDQNLHINDHFWFGNRWWLIYSLLLRDQKLVILFWSFIACQLVINLVNIWINDQIYDRIYDQTIDHMTN